MTQANSSGETETKTASPSVNVSVEEPGPIASVSESGSSQTSTGSEDQFEQLKEQVLSILSELPVYLSNFFGEYQKPIITVTLILATLVTVKVTLAVIDALNDIPLLAPTFELIGMGYTAWFVYRYLLRASNRQELVAELDSFKEQIFAERPTDNRPCSQGSVRYEVGNPRRAGTLFGGECLGLRRANTPQHSRVGVHAPARRSAREDAVDPGPAPLTRRGTPVLRHAGDRESLKGATSGGHRPRRVFGPVRCELSGEIKALQSRSGPGA
jgi:glutamyl-tRNA synthetase